MCVDTVVTCTLSQPNDEITIIIDPSHASMHTPAFPVEPSVRTPALRDHTPAFPVEPSVRTPALRDHTPAIPSYEQISSVAAVAAATSDAACQTDNTLEDTRWNFLMASIQALQHQMLAIQNFVVNR